MDDQNIRIQRASNGYTVSVRDPEIVKENMQKDSRYKNPEVDYVFEDSAGVKKFIEDNLDTLLVKCDDEYETGFQKALKGD